MGEGWDRKDKELKKFTECDGEVAVRTYICQETGESITVTSDPSVTPTIYNLSAPVASTEVSQALSSNVKQLIIRVRDKTANAQVAFVATQSATNYITIRGGTVLTLTGLKAPSLTVYVQTDKSSQTVEILEWT